jgi:LemA protein
MALSLMLALVALLFFWAAGVRQRLSASRAAIVQAFAQLEPQLQRRHEALADLADACRSLAPQARDALERVMAARLQVMAAAELVRHGPALAGPIKSLDLAEASVAQALAGLATWVEPVLSEQAAPTREPGVQQAWQTLAAARQNVQFASQACNQCLAAHNAAVVRLPARVVAAWMGLSSLPLLTVNKHG